MNKFIDLIDKKFGKLTPIKYLGNHIYICLCDCGKKKNILKYNLVSGNTKSCGCLNIEKTTKMGKLNVKHGYKGTRTYNIWQAMKQRCNNPKTIEYKHYGGKGIAVCKRWMKFENFIKDIGEIPVGLTLDRINNNKGYSPKNCKLSTMKEQERNKTNNHILNYKNKQQCLTAIAEQHNINRKTLEHRLNRGLSIEEALTIPIRKKEKKNETC